MIPNGSARYGILAAALLASGIIGCQRPSIVHVPLAYRPTDTLQVPKIEGGLPPDLRLAITVTNGRSDRVDIGENVEKDTVVPVLPEQTTPEQFLQEAVSLELSRAGFAVATEAAQGTRVLHLDLRRFWTQESSMYRGTINVNAELTDPSGKQLWQGGIAGDSKRFGRSLSPENYQETFSDASIDLVHNLLSSEGFIRALQAPVKPAPKPGKQRRHH